jgi:glycosyltransferase involved in cell wall biosynthesis
MVSEQDHKQRILHVVGTFSMGGLETWLIELLGYWNKRGFCAYQIDFLAAGGAADLLDDEVKALGANIIYLRYGRSNLITFIRNFRRILKHGSYIAIHDHQGYASGWHFFMGAGLLPSIRVTHIHNALLELKYRTNARRLTAWIGKHLVRYFATHVVGTSRQVITEYGFDAPRFHRIPKAALYCGIDVARFSADAVAAKLSVCREFGWPEDAKIILSVGRIDRGSDLSLSGQKNTGMSVSIGIECARLDPRVRMLFVGALSSAVPIFEQHIAAAGLSERIRFAGIRRDVDRLMLAGNALLFPSLQEGLGMVVIEAQAAGLPVLASATVPRECIITPELVRFQKLEAGVAAWATDLLQLIGQPRNIIESNKRVAASAFSIDNSARALLKLYCEGLLK